MTSHKTGTRQEWLAARLELLAAEKALTRRGGLRTRARWSSVQGTCLALGVLSRRGAG
jgi:predicted dithiol-disulfide oxidoreductase (DUF899 family)